MVILAMKKTTYMQILRQIMCLSILAVCLGLGISSCQRGQNEPISEEVQSQQGRLVTIAVSANVAIDDARALDYMLSENGSFRRNLKESTLDMWTILRSTDPSKPVYKAQLKWTVLNNNTLKIEQKIELPKEIDEDINTGEWYASCFLVGQSGRSGQSFSFDESKNRLSITTPAQGADFDYKPGAGATTSIAAQTETPNVPVIYIMPWTRVSVGVVRIDGADTKAIVFSGAQLAPQGSVLRFRVNTAPATFHLARYHSPSEDDDAPKVDNTTPSEGGLEGEDDYNNASSLPVHGKKLTLYTLEESKVNPYYFDLGLRDLSVHLPRVEAAINKPALWRNSTWTPQTLSIKGRLSGYYDFAGATPRAGGVPSFVADDTEDKTYVFNFPNPEVLTFETAAKELGYLYFWAGAEELTISGTLSATPSNEINEARERYRWKQGLRWQASGPHIFHWFLPAGVSGIIGGSHTPVTPDNLGFGSGAYHMNGIWDFDTFTVKTDIDPITLSLSNGKTKRVTLNYKPQAYIRKLQGIAS